jgi:MFS transporter, DHA1 family, multidrug resistance protein
LTLNRLPEALHPDRLVCLISSSMAMERLGRIAGTALAVQSFDGALIGVFIGQQFDGTTGPLIRASPPVICWPCACEGGRLFREREGA